MQYASVVEQKVQSAEAARGLVEQGLNVRGPGDIRCHRERGLAKLARHLFNAVPAPADQHHTGSFSDHRGRASASNATARARYDANLAV